MVSFWKKSYSIFFYLNSIGSSANAISCLDNVNVEVLIELTQPLGRAQPRNACSYDENIVDCCGFVGHVSR